MSVAAPTAPPVSNAPRLITGEEFVLLDGHEQMDLVHGTVVRPPHGERYMPSATHGRVCIQIGRHLGNFVYDNKLGWVCGNDTSIRLRRNPDTVRGPDVCYLSNARLPPGLRMEGVLDVLPELVVEVRSPSNSWPKVLIKTREYLEAGVTAVMVVDPEEETATVFRNEEFHQTFHDNDVLELPDVLPGFSVPLPRLFE